MQSFITLTRRLIFLLITFLCAYMFHHLSSIVYFIHLIPVPFIFNKTTLTVIQIAYYNLSHSLPQTEWALLILFLNA